LALIGKIRAGFEEQAEACRRMGSPFTAGICLSLAEGLDERSRFGRTILLWEGHPLKDALPLRAAGALNYLVRGGLASELEPFYPPHEFVGVDALWPPISVTIERHDEFLTGFLSSPPQTNEVGRSAAILAGCLTIAERTGLPLETYEIGASAGLNMGFDAYRYRLGDATWGATESAVFIPCEWRGPLPPLLAPLTVRSRFGCDRRPLDPSSTEDHDRLLAYIWPDQTERVARTEAALEFAAHAPWRVENADAAEWVERCFEGVRPGAVKVLLHTVVWQYLDDETRARITSAMERAGAQASVDAPVAWLSLEYDGESPGAALNLRLWPSGSSQTIGRADFHGRWVEFRGL
jgi:hypothetical protein